MTTRQVTSAPVLNVSCFLRNVGHLPEYWRVPFPPQLDSWAPGSPPSLAMKILQMVLLCLLISTCVAQTGASGALSAAPTRPKIVGVAHIGLRTDNLDAARKFYMGVLGFKEPFRLDKEPAEGTGLLLTYFKVNDHQYMKMFTVLRDL